MYYSVVWKAKKYKIDHNNIPHTSIRIELVTVQYWLISVLHFLVVVLCAKHLIIQQQQMSALHYIINIEYSPIICVLSFECSIVFNQ